MLVTVHLIQFLGDFQENFLHGMSGIISLKKEINNLGDQCVPVEMKLL